jgi:hypothetical protein
MSDIKISEAAEEMGLETDLLMRHGRRIRNHLRIGGLSLIGLEMREIERETARSKQNLPKEKAIPQVPKSASPVNSPDVLPKMKAHAGKAARKSSGAGRSTTGVRQTAPEHNRVGILQMSCQRLRPIKRKLRGSHPAPVRLSQSLRSPGL